MAAKRDCSQWIKIKIVLQERRNWSVSARTRITYLRLFQIISVDVKVWGVKRKGGGEIYF